MMGNPYADPVVWGIGKYVARVQLERWVEVADKLDVGYLSLFV